MNQGLLNVVNRIIEHFDRDDVLMGVNPNGVCKYRGEYFGKVTYCAVGCLLNDEMVERLESIPACSEGGNVNLWESGGSISVWWQKSNYDMATRAWIDKFCDELGLNWSGMIALGYIQKLHDSNHRSREAFVAIMKGIRDGVVIYHPGVEKSGAESLVQIKGWAEQVIMRLHTQ